jgi:hypothetical protein
MTMYNASRAEGSAVRTPGDETVRAEPFDAIEFNLGQFWLD